LSGYLHEGEASSELQDAAASDLTSLGVVPDWPVALHAETLVYGDQTFTVPPPWHEDQVELGVVGETGDGTAHLEGDQSRGVSDEGGIAVM